MKIRTMLGLGLLGTAVYAHKQRGGEFTLDSVKNSFNDLWKFIQNKAGEMKDKAGELTDKAQDKGRDLASKAKSTMRDVGDKAKNSLDEGTGFGSSGYVPPGTQRH